VKKFGLSCKEPLRARLPTSIASLPILPLVELATTAPLRLVFLPVLIVTELVPITEV
jgi:hypothetical protein